MAKISESISNGANATLEWVDKRLPVSSFWNAVMTGYQAPKNFNFFGVLSDAPPVIRPVIRLR